MPNDQTLYGYQAKGVEWLTSWRDNGYGFKCEPNVGMIADEPGLGKTAQALATIRSLILEGKRILLVVPGATIIQWQKQYERWVLDFEGDPFGSTSLAALRGTKASVPKDVSCICSHAMLAKTDFIDKLAAANFDGIVIDEIHKFGSTGTKRVKHLWALINLTASHFEDCRIALSGTPARNYAKEIYNIAHFLAPLKFRNIQDFARKYLTWDGKALGNPRQFHDDFAPFYLRRMVSEVQKDLPSIRRTKLYTEVSDPFLAKAYNKEVDLMENFMNNASRVDSFSLLGYLQRLRHITGIAKAAEPSIIEPILEYIMEGEVNQKIVIGIHHHLVAARLRNSALGSCKCGLLRMAHFELDDDLKETHRTAKNGCTEYISAIPFFYIRGGMGDYAKEHEKQNFIDCTAPAILLLSIKAAGEGIDGLQFAATKSVVLERQWNGADELQFEKRIHRTGQKMSCEIEYTMASGTVDEFFDNLVDEKRRITTQVEDVNYESNPAFLKSLAEKVIQTRLPTHVQRDVETIMESAFYDLEQLQTTLNSELVEN